MPLKAVSREAECSFAARTFCDENGTGGLHARFTSVVAAFTTGSGQTSTVEPFGYRLTAIIATVFCIIGAVLFFFYDEKGVMKKIAEKEDKNA